MFWANFKLKKEFKNFFVSNSLKAINAVNEFETKKFLNSFFSSKFAQNKNSQIKSFKKFIKSWDGKKNLIFVTHYVFISEILDYAPSSGEIIVSDKDLKVIDTIEIEY